MSLRGRLWVWRAVRRIRQMPVHHTRYGYRIHKPSIHDHFRWTGGRAFIDGEFKYVDPV